jgi:hypothetical protein
MLNPASQMSSTTPMDFESGFRDVYSDLTASSGKSLDLNEFYKRARNGLYQLGSSQRGLWMHNERTISPKDFDIIQLNPNDPSSQKYYVNPHAVARTVIDHFPTFIARLNDPSPQHDAMRAKFMEFFGDFRV